MSEEDAWIHHGSPLPRAPTVLGTFVNTLRWFLLSESILEINTFFPQIGRAHV